MPETSKHQASKYPMFHYNYGETKNCRTHYRMCENNGLSQQHHHPAFCIGNYLLYWFTYTAACFCNNITLQHIKIQLIVQLTLLVTSTCHACKHRS